MEFFMVGLGGFFGAIARYLVYLFERSLGAHAFPFGTLVINLSGCVLAGFLLAVVERPLPMNRHLVLLCSMGWVGSFTTFSTLSLESLQLIRSNQTVLAGINIVANAILGIGAVGLGRAALLRIWN